MRHDPKWIDTRRKESSLGRVVLVGRVRIVRECLDEGIRRRYPTIRVLHASGLDALDQMALGSADVVFVDASHAGSEFGLDALRAALPGLRVIVLTGDGVANIGVAEGVRLPASLAALLFMIGAACGLSGPPTAEPDAEPDWRALTPREREVAEGLLEGKPNKVIAHELGLSDNTIKMHLTQIMRKLDVTNRTQVALLLGAGREASSQSSGPRPGGAALFSPNRSLQSPS